MGEPVCRSSPDDVIHWFGPALYFGIANRVLSLRCRFCPLGRFLPASTPPVHVMDDEGCDRAAANAPIGFRWSPPPTTTNKNTNMHTAREYDFSLLRIVDPSLGRGTHPAPMLKKL
jgi:hypothetical protein